MTAAAQSSRSRGRDEKNWERDGAEFESNTGMNAPKLWITRFPFSCHMQLHWNKAFPFSPADMWVSLWTLDKGWYKADVITVTWLERVCSTVTHRLAVCFKDVFGSFPASYLYSRTQKCIIPNKNNGTRKNKSRKHSCICFICGHFTLYWTGRCREETGKYAERRGDEMQEISQQQAWNQYSKSTLAFSRSLLVNHNFPLD